MQHSGLPVSGAGGAAAQAFGRHSRLEGNFGIGSWVFPTFLTSGLPLPIAIGLSDFPTTATSGSIPNRSSHRWVCPSAISGGRFFASCFYKA